MTATQVLIDGDGRIAHVAPSPDLKPWLSAADIGMPALTLCAPPHRRLAVALFASVRSRKHVATASLRLQSGGEPGPWVHCRAMRQQQDGASHLMIVLRPVSAEAGRLPSGIGRQARRTLATALAARQALGGLAPADDGWLLLLAMFVRESDGRTLTVRTAVTICRGRTAALDRWTTLLAEAGLVTTSTDSGLALTGTGRRQVRAILCAALMDAPSLR